MGPLDQLKQQIGEVVNALTDDFPQGSTNKDYQEV